eukprot:Awhi_evm1s8941
MIADSRRYTLSKNNRGLPLSSGDVLALMPPIRYLTDDAVVFKFLINIHTRPLAYFLFTGTTKSIANDLLNTCALRTSVPLENLCLFFYPIIASAGGGVGKGKPTLFEDNNCLFTILEKHYDCEICVCEKEYFQKLKNKKINKQADKKSQSTAHNDTFTNATTMVNAATDHVNSNNNNTNNNNHDNNSNNNNNKNNNHNHNHNHNHNYNYNNNISFNASTNTSSNDGNNALEFPNKLMRKLSSKGSSKKPQFNNSNLFDVSEDDSYNCKISPLTSATTYTLKVPSSRRPSATPLNSVDDLGVDIHVATDFIGDFSVDRHVGVQSDLQSDNKLKRQTMNRFPSVDDLRTVAGVNATTLRHSRSINWLETVANEGHSQDKAVAGHNYADIIFADSILGVARPRRKRSVVVSKINRVNNDV